MPTYSIPGFTDPFSSLSHLLGAAVFACLTPALLRRGRGDRVREASLRVFAFSTIFLLLMSGTFHLLQHHTDARAVFMRLDHAAIFALIAATFTPMHAVLFRGYWRRVPLAVVWTAAAAGIALKSAYFGETPEWLGVSSYLVLGWFGAVSGVALWHRHGPWLVLPLLWGGLAYTAGAVLEFLRWPVAVAGVIGPHELFHVFVLAGLALHWRFVWSFADGAVPPLRVSPTGEARAADHERKGFASRRARNAACASSDRGS